MSPPLIVLTTDFGVSSPYVAAMKGVLLTLAREATIVDLTHAIEPQNIHQAALVVADFAPWFPVGAVHIVVVDPGVGSERALVVAEIGGRLYLAPDNGALSLLARRTAPSRIFRLEERSWWLPHVSTTFHGRDILAPVAARLSQGLDPAQLGPPHARLVELDWPEVRIMAQRISGTVVSVDSFGNLVTDITGEMLKSAPRAESTRILCGEHETFGLFQTYADQPPMTLVALIGSSDRMELAIVDDNAALMLGVGVGEKVTVSW